MSMIEQQVNKIRKAAKCVYLATDKEVADDIASTLNQAADTIEALSAKLAKANMENGGGWIACEDRLPDIECDVLLSLISLDIYTGFRANTEGMFYVWGEGCVEYENVLAWKFLPEPYRPQPQMSWL